MTAKHIAQPFPDPTAIFMDHFEVTVKFRATVVPVSTGNFQGDNNLSGKSLSLLQLFSLPCIRQERFRPAGQLHKQDSR